MVAALVAAPGAHAAASPRQQQAFDRQRFVVPVREAICIDTIADHGTPRSTSSRNSALCVFFVDKFRPRPSCFVGGAVGGGHDLTARKSQACLADLP